MMAWSPIILFAALMIGYPLVQLAALRFRRPHRIRFRDLIRTLTERYTDRREQQALAQLMLDSRGHWPDPIAHLMLPVVITTDVLRGIRPNDPAEIQKSLRFVRAILQVEFGISADAPIWEDPEFDRAMRMSTKLRITNSPISFGIGLILSLPAMLLVRMFGRGGDRNESFRQEVLARFAGADRAIFN